MQKTKKQIEDYLAELNDTRTTVLVCKRHNYVAGGPKFPVEGCSDCWYAFFFHHLAKMPPDMRREKLEELKAVIHHTVESVERGEFDFEPDPRPIIHYEKDGLN
jgi:hypothetical protein